MYNPIWTDKPKNENWLIPIAILGLIGMVMFGYVLFRVGFNIVKGLIALIITLF